MKKFKNFKNLVHQYIERLKFDNNHYNDHNIPENEPLVALTYGELLPTSVTELINKLNVNHNDVFYDLGSGTGKIVAQFYLETMAKKVVGVEISQSRYACSERMKQYLNEKIVKHNQIIEYINNNICKVDFSDATIIYLCSTCFDNKLLDWVIEKIKQCNKIRAILTLKNFDNPSQLTDMGFNCEIISTPSSWSSSTICHYYYK